MADAKRVSLFARWVSISPSGVTPPSRSACRPSSEAKGCSKLDLGPRWAAQPARSPPYRNTQMLCLSITQLVFFFFFFSLFFSLRFTEGALITAGEQEKPGRIAAPPTAAAQTGGPQDARACVSHPPSPAAAAPPRLSRDPGKPSRPVSSCLPLAASLYPH